MSETLHMSCVAISGRAVLIAGRPGRGKSDLALRLIDRGAALVSDDYTIVRAEGGQLVATAPETISGRIEVRGVGIVDFPPASDVPVALCVDLDGAVERLPPEDERAAIVGVPVPLIHLDARESSAPIKVEAALARIPGA